MAYGYPGTQPTGSAWTWKKTQNLMGWIGFTLGHLGKLTGCPDSTWLSTGSGSGQVLRVGFSSLADNVLCLIWQDNNLVLALSTVYYSTNVIECLRKRLKKTSTNTGIVLKIFDNNVTKKLPISIFINNYNHHMNGVNIAN